ncbi:hypothetical protein GCM10022251_41650 [Phytohabitans flavus]|uniref:Uncharacterized protein n=1 Tax=Phytohabitans flavus TaxID=1076124 RepID=A0A6F8Y0U3_9ACTN|nr:hypothetical protein Pflav_060010 [Phytohabitans flavus]
MFVQQQRRDQVSGEDEEHVDAEEATGHEADSAVKRQHGGDRQATHAVKGRPVRKATTRFTRHRACLPATSDFMPPRSRTPRGAARRHTDLLGANLAELSPGTATDLAVANYHRLCY